MKEELISIIVPVYNVEKYLNRCLDSILNQTYRNIEIILINDGSKDNSINIIKEYKEKDERIIVIDRENKGVLYTRIEGFNKATGKYITFIDSDDWVENNIIEILYNKLIEYNADVVKCEFGYNESNVASGKINIKQDYFIDKPNFEPNFYDMFLYNMNIHTVWAQMFKKDLLNKYIENIDTNISMGDDLEINTQLYKNISSILFIPDVLYHYNYNNDSITKTLKTEKLKNNIIDITKSYLKVYNSIGNFKINNEVKYKQSVINRLLDEVNNYQIILIGALKNRKESIKYLKWYYFEYEDMLLINKEMKNINLNIENLKYKIFYKRIYKNIEIAYLISLLIWKRRIIKNKIKGQHK